MTWNSKWQYDDTIYAKKALRQPITYEQFLESSIKHFSKQDDLSEEEKMELAEERAMRYFNSSSTFAAKDENDIYIDEELLFSNLKI